MYQTHSPRAKGGRGLESSEAREAAPRIQTVPHAGAVFGVEGTPYGIGGIKGSTDGPLTEVHVFWLAGMSCDGCSVAVTGATNPSVEDLLAGNIPGLPKVVLHHPVLSPEAGEAFVKPFKEAADGTLGDPFVVVYEGSIADERIAKRTGGYFSAMGVEAIDGDDHGSPVPTATWLERMAPRAAATNRSTDALCNFAVPVRTHPLSLR